MWCSFSLITGSLHLFTKDLRNSCLVEGRCSPKADRLASSRVLYSSCRPSVISSLSLTFSERKKKKLTTNLIVQMKSLKSAILQLQYDLNLLLSSAMLVLMRQEHLHHPKAQLFITTSWHFKYKLLCLPTSGSSTTKSLLRIVTILLWILMAVKWIGTSPRAYLLHRNYCAF